MSKQVSWTIFAWTIGIILLLFTASFGLTASAVEKVDSAYQNLYELRQDIEVIKNDLKWIKQKI